MCIFTWWCRIPKAADIPIYSNICQYHLYFPPEVIRRWFRLGGWNDIEELFHYFFIRIKTPDIVCLQIFKPWLNEVDYVTKKYECHFWRCLWKSHSTANTYLNLTLNILLVMCIRCEHQLIYILYFCYIRFLKYSIK